MDEEVEQTPERRKTLSCGLYMNCPENLKESLESALKNGYHFIVTQIIHPNFHEGFKGTDADHVLGRSDRILKSTEWSRLVVAELKTNAEEQGKKSQEDIFDKKQLSKDIGFASHLGVPAILFTLTKSKNNQLARIVNSKIKQCNLGTSYTTWIQVPMVHSSRNDPIGEAEEEDTWEWWNSFRVLCDYDRRVGLILAVPDIKRLPTLKEIDRWIGEPVKALILKASYFLINQYGKPVLPRAHQEIIKKFMTIDVQYIIHLDIEGTDFSLYVKYLNYLGKKLYVCDAMAEFVEGYDDYLQNPLQPLTENLEATIYEVFEKDIVKYDTYQKAFHEALEQWSEDRIPVVMIVGAGRGPLVQAVINVSNNLGKEVKIYAVEKNPYAMNTLVHRNKDEWDSKVILVKDDMRDWTAPELADILISELLGSFGDNELSPECLDGAQRFLNPKSGISIPKQYISFIAPLQSVKILNEIRANRNVFKTFLQRFETPYVVHLANYYQLAETKPLFEFNHPNFGENSPDNTRYKLIEFPPLSKAAVLTGIAGFFETVLHGNVTLSTNPLTHTPDMISWFPLVFPLINPIQLKAGDVIKVAFWREETADKVWYEWCLESPIKTPIMNPSGRSYSLKKH